MSNKTAMQQLIEKLNNIDGEDSEWSDDFKSGINRARLVATSLLELEKKQIVDAWEDGYGSGCAVGGQDYTTETKEDTGENYFIQTFTQ